MKISKVDVFIIVAVIMIATIFFYKAGYLTPPSKEDIEGETPQKNITEEHIPTPPPSLIIPSRRTITGEDEGCHYKSVLVGREWWYFTAVFNDQDSELKDWSVAISFNHMAYGDLFGELKPDVLMVTLYDTNGNVYGGLVNKKRGTLDATTPGVDVTFEHSWVQGQYPKWHVHVEDDEIDEQHEIKIDLDYLAHSFPLWTYGTKLLNNSKSKLTNYVFIGCTVTGTVTLDGKTYRVKGTGNHEHAWSPFYIRRSFIDGWDWFHITLENGWQMFLSKFYPTPQSVTSKFSKIQPFGTLLLTPDGETFTEFNVFDLQPKQREKIFLFTKFPTSFTVSAKRTHNILMQRIDLKLSLDISTDNTYQQVWKFPTYVGIKIGTCKVEGTVSWTDGEKDYNLDLNGSGITWTTRALP
ncbi:MAG TPA: hypothetical protein EYP23_06355 [Thermoplasmata archaeon]|nr:hypothetical protein [Thermoplasmata archaeon]